jgi:trans-aconitate methyltransferase
MWNPSQYERFKAERKQPFIDLVALIERRTHMRILDLGCGTGELTRELHETLGAGETIGVDNSEAMLAKARSGSGIHFEQGDIETYTPPHAVDLVFSNAALHWVRDHEAMLAEANRILKPGGRFVAEFGGHGNIAAIRAAFIAVLERHGFAAREDNVNYYPTPETYSRRLAMHGFTVGRIALIPRPTPLGEGGMIEWLRTFRRGVIDSLPESIRDTVVEETVELLANVLRDESSNWTADYVRLRFIAKT